MNSGATLVILFDGQDQLARLIQYVLLGMTLT